MGGTADVREPQVLQVRSLRLLARVQLLWSRAVGGCARELYGKAPIPFVCLALCSGALTSYVQLIWFLRAQHNCTSCMKLHMPLTTTVFCMSCSISSVCLCLVLLQSIKRDSAGLGGGSRQRRACGRQCKAESASCAHRNISQPESGFCWMHCQVRRWAVLSIGGAHPAGASGSSQSLRHVLPALRR